MGLSSHLHDLSGGSIPILLVAAAAGWVSYLRSLLFCLIHSFGFHHFRTHDDADASAMSSCLAGCLVLAEQLSSTHPSFTYVSEEETPVGEAAEEPHCVVCLGGLGEGERVRRLACCRRVFHRECLDGWFDEGRLSCPLCRSPLAPEDCRTDTEPRVGAELVAWFAPY